MLSVTAITVYPVKGARGIEVNEAALTDTGELPKNPVL